METLGDFPAVYLVCFPDRPGAAVQALGKSGPGGAGRSAPVKTNSFSTKTHYFYTIYRGSDAPGIAILKYAKFANLTLDMQIIRGKMYVNDFRLFIAIGSNGG